MSDKMTVNNNGVITTKAKSLRKYLAMMSMKHRDKAWYRAMKDEFIRKERCEPVIRLAFNGLVEWVRLFGPLQFVTPLFNPVFSIVPNLEMQHVTFKVRLKKESVDRTCLQCRFTRKIQARRNSQGAEEA